VRTSLISGIEQASAWVVETLRADGAVLACGNGGSAADALHLCEEFTGRYRSNRRSLRAVCLNADPTAMTCIGNDFGFDKIYSRHLEGVGRRGDILFAFSTSGNSPNILEALNAAKKIGIRTVLLSGKDGGKASSLADLSLIVPSSNTARIQEVHGFILHAVLEAVEVAFPA